MGFFTVDKFGFPVPGGTYTNLPPGPWSQEVVGGGGPGAAGMEFPQDALRALSAPPSSAGGMEASQAKMRAARDMSGFDPGMGQARLSPQEEEQMRRMFEMRQRMMEQMRMRAERDWSGMAQMGGFAGPKEGMPMPQLPKADFYGPQSRMQPQQVEEVMQQQSLPRGGY